MAGHVDDFSGPAVFYRLNTLTPGDEVIIDTADQYDHLPGALVETCARSDARH